MIPWAVLCGWGRRNKLFLRRFCHSKNKKNLAITIYFISDQHCQGHPGHYFDPTFLGQYLIKKFKDE